MPYRVLVSDLDGTLLDTLQDMADAVNLSLDRLGLPQHEVSAYRYFVGDGRRAMAMRALPEEYRTDEDMLERLLALISEEYDRRWIDHSVPYPGVPELLDTLSERGVRLSVLSNKPQVYTGPMVNQILSRWSFECVVGESAALPRKPDPAGALQIAERMGVSPQDCLYIGDSGVDMQTATASGMYPVGVLWGFRDADELLAGGAKVLAAHPRDILPLFDL
jgi:phosphoglycolate phosphatase